MGQLVKGHPVGRTFFCAKGGAFKNGTNPTEDQKQSLIADGFKLIPHNAPVGEDEAEAPAAKTAVATSASISGAPPSGPQTEPKK